MAVGQTGARPPWIFVYMLPAGPDGVAERHAGRRRDPAERPPSEASAESERFVDARGRGSSSRRAGKRREVRGAAADAGGS